MKSMLHEASSVAKAIEKAWLESGKPGEFSINILEVGEKGFLGFTKRPAVVSITFDPKRQSDKSRGKRPDTQERRPAAQQQQTQSRDAQLAKKKPAPVTQRQIVGNLEDRRSPERSTDHQERPAQRSLEEVWSAELSTQVADWFKELVQLMGVSGSVTSKVDNKVLQLYLDGRITSEGDDEKAACISLSYLLMQFLKKKYKRKFHSNHILITTRGIVSHDKQRSSSPAE
jgi:predicted RNA-binding protein Jag